MKTRLSFIAFAMVAALLAVSCKNIKNSTPTFDEVQAQNQVMADSVMTMLDEFANLYINATEESFEIPQFIITDQEKLVKPDYLLDPSVVNTLTTRSQKVNAMAMLVVSREVRWIYGMPLEDTDAALAKLFAETNFPASAEVSSQYEKKPSDIYREDFEVFKERGELDYFWKFQKAMLFSIHYVIAQNPELFFSKFTQEQWAALYDRLEYTTNACYELAKYDEAFRVTPIVTDDEIVKSIRSIEYAKQFFIENKEAFVNQYNDLI